VVKVAEEVVREELHGGAKLAAGSLGWGKMMVRKSLGPASLAGAAGSLLVQEGCGDKALLLVWSESSGCLIGDGQ
jgi:hypothetical protein